MKLFSGQGSIIHDGLVDSADWVVPLTLLFGQVMLTDGMDGSWESRSRLLDLFMGWSTISLLYSGTLLALYASLSAESIGIPMLHSLTVLNLILKF